MTKSLARFSPDMDLANNLSTDRLMSREEALALTNRIKASVSSIRHMLYEIFTRRGWESMGYESYAEYLKDQFDVSTSYLRRQTNAALLEAELGLEIDSMRESQCRAIIETLERKIDQARAYHLTHARVDNPTAQDYQVSAWMVYVDSANDYVKGRMLSGELSPKTAFAINKRLEEYERLEDDSGLSSLIVDVTDIELIPMLERLAWRSQPSETWVEILLSRTIPAFPEPIPLSKASASNLRAWLDYASTEHMLKAGNDRRNKYVELDELVARIISLAEKVVSVVDNGLAKELQELIDQYKTMKEQ